MAKLHDIDKLAIGFDKKDQLNIVKPLKRWIRMALKTATPIELGELNIKEMPLRSVRVYSNQSSADLELLSDLATTKRVRRSKHSVQQISKTQRRNSRSYTAKKPTEFLSEKLTVW